MDLEVVVWMFHPTMAKCWWLIEYNRSVQNNVPGRYWGVRVFVGCLELYLLLRWRLFYWIDVASRVGACGSSYFDRHQDVVQLLQGWLLTGKRLFGLSWGWAMKLVLFNLASPGVVAS